MSDFGELFTDSVVDPLMEHMGESATVTPAGGEAAAVTLIEGSLSEEHRADRGTKKVRGPVFVLATAEVTVATLIDAKLTYRSQHYSIAEVLDLDEDAGVVTVRCVQTTEAERSRPGLREGPSW